MKETACRFKRLSFSTNNENTLSNMFCIQVCVGLCRVEKREKKGTSWSFDYLVSRGSTTPTNSSSKMGLWAVFAPWCEFWGTESIWKSTINIIIFWSQRDIFLTESLRNNLRAQSLGWKRQTSEATLLLQRKPDNQDGTGLNANCFVRALATK